MLSHEKVAPGWLMIIYRVPSTPSTSRVTIWKRVKELGAHLLQQSVYVLPNIPRVKELLNQLKEQIQHLGGECKMIEIASLGEEQEKEVIAGFNSSREEEYAEVIKACNELLQEIEEESKTEDFHYADLEENEKHFQRVRELFDSVMRRDYFGSPVQPRALALVKECQHKFEQFSQEVFSREGIVSEEKKTPPEQGTRYKERQTVTKEELPDKIQKMTNSLGRGVLEVEGKRVGDVPDSAVLECEYREHKGERTLQIRIEWNTVRRGKKPS